MAMKSDWHRDQYFPKSQRKNRLKGFLVALLFMATILGLIALAGYLLG